MIEDTAEPSTDQGPGPKPAPAAAGRRGVGVVIVNYATARLVIDALPPLLAELDRLEAAEPHRVVVVDNASPGPDVTALSDAIATHGWGPRVRLVASPINGGFSAGNNLGFRALREDGMHPEAVLLHNPDAAVRPGALAEMLRVMRTTPSAGFVGPRQASPDGSSWSGAFPFPSLASEVAQALGINALAERYPTVIEGLEAPTRVDWVSGTATLIRGEALEALGDMDEGYFLYHEEVDYARRAAALGWESWHAPAAVFEHDAGSATGVSDGRARRGRTPDYRFQSWARYYAKNHGTGYARLTAAAVVLAIILGDTQRWLRGKAAPSSEGYLLDFTRRALFRRLSPLPTASTAWAQAKAPGGHRGTGAGPTLKSAPR